MKSLVIKVLLWLILCGSSMARMGETLDQIEKRYGAPVKRTQISPSEIMCRYVHRGLLIAVSFLDGSSNSEIFQKEDGDKFYDNETELIREANKNNGTWTQTDKRIWTLADGTVAFDMKGPPPMYAVMTSRWRQHIKEDNQQKQKEALKDF